MIEALKGVLELIVALGIGAFLTWFLYIGVGGKLYEISSAYAGASSWWRRAIGGVAWIAHLFAMLLAVVVALFTLKVLVQWLIH